MHRKLICTIASVAMLAGLLFIGATPAQAAPPTDTKNFYPDDTSGNNGDATLLSDRFDGVDTTVHLANVSTPDTDRVQWRLCASGTVGADGTETLTQAQFDACTITIGEDTSGTTPVGGPPANVDEAYEFNWDIPGSEDGATRDIVAAACIGAGNDVEGADANCTVDVENDVLLDDSQTAVPQTSSGEIVSLCTTDVGGPQPGPTGDACVRGEGGTDAEVDARFVPFGHGSNVPNDGFVFRARTSDDVTSHAYFIGPGDATNDPDQSFNGSGFCTLIFTGTNFKEWECAVADGEVTPDAELFLNTPEQGGGPGNCAGSPPFCVVDQHYVVSNDRRPASVVTTFHSDPDLTQAEQCASPDDAETNDLGDFEEVLFCVTDQFGQPLDTSVTFESSGLASAGFDSSECTAQNHDGSADGVDEHCDGSTGSDGISSAFINNPDDFDPGEPANLGVQTVTACVEGEPAPADPAHGCADEAANVTDSVNKTWESDAAVVRLVFGDKSANCFTGPTFRENRVGDTDNLKACVFDGFGNKVPTTGDDDGFLEWSIDPGNDDDVDTQFLGVPPSETDADGEAVAQIEAIDPGSDDPSVCLREDDTGDFLSCDFVQKNVRPAGPGPGPGRARSKVSINHKSGPHRFKGRVTSPRNSCEGAGRRVTVKRRRPGPDRTIGSDQTNGAGRYVIRHRRTAQKKAYYARVRRNADCRADSSRIIRRR